MRSTTVPVIQHWLSNVILKAFWNKNRNVYGGPLRAFDLAEDMEGSTACARNLCSYIGVADRSAVLCLLISVFAYTSIYWFLWLFGVYHILFRTPGQIRASLKINLQSSNHLPVRNLQLLRSSSIPSIQLHLGLTTITFSIVVFFIHYYLFFEHCLLISF